MSDKVFPASKPTATGTTTTTTTGAKGATNPIPTAAAAKTNLYNPTARPPYRQQPYNRRYHHRSGRSICCRCCFWTILVVLILLLLAAIAGAALYILYRPHRPTFAIPSLRIHRLNLTAASDSASGHVATLLNFTVTSKNPNSHLTFSYDDFTITAYEEPGNVFLGNGSLPAFISGKKNETAFRNVVVLGSNEVDAESVNALRSDLGNKNGVVTLRIEMDTKVTVKLDRLKTKKVGFRVTCDGIKGAVPKGKSPTVAVTSGSKCKVDLRIKIWRFTF